MFQMYFFFHNPILCTYIPQKILLPPPPQVHIKKAMRLSPYYPASYLMFLADSYFSIRRYDESIAANKQLLERARMGEWPIYSPHLGLASNYMLLGKEEKARFHADEVLKANPSFSLKTFQSRNLYKRSWQL